MSDKKVSIGLGIGIVLIPLIFSWFTLRKGYSGKAKIISFSWLAISILVVSLAPPPEKPVAEENIVSSTTQQVSSKSQEPLKTVVEKVEPQKWYEGGEVRGKTALDWQKATYNQKLVTAAGLYQALYNAHKLAPSVSSKINSVDDLRPYAESLVTALDTSFEEKEDPQENKQMFTNQKINDTSIILMMMQGHLK
ncbi:hypothetical protein [Vibrio quintilis]|uniref:Uncharacterized protein n=1 Tax=Vibrio quintilis TaxID=1117707 RepID=A0A1M7YZ41_9VIBR|nr:hypothetical protein [Vibrio quintilis]SHO57855.1 hypothetical protein VQ7734_03625 [Vibrio quintilis]